MWSLLVALLIWETRVVRVGGIKFEIMRFIAVIVLLIGFIFVMFYASSREYKDKKK
jgi:hypothetical protein